MLTAGKYLPERAALDPVSSNARLSVGGQVSPSFLDVNQHSAHLNVRASGPNLTLPRCWRFSLAFIAVMAFHLVAVYLFLHNRGSRVALISSEPMWATIITLEDSSAREERTSPTTPIDTEIATSKSQAAPKKEEPARVPPPVTVAPARTTPDRAASADGATGPVSSEVPPPPSLGTGLAQALRIHQPNIPPIAFIPPPTAANPSGLLTEVRHCSDRVEDDGEAPHRAEGNCPTH